MKVMTLVSLLVLPAVVSMNPPDLGLVGGVFELQLDDPNPMTYVIAAIGIVVLIGAVTFSKRQSSQLTVD